MMKSTKMVLFLVLALALTLASGARIHKKKSLQASCWNQLPGQAHDIGVGADGSVWIIGNNAVPGGYGIYKYNSGSNSWNGISGGAVRISVDPSGLPWVVDANGQIFQGTAAGGWNQLPGGATDIGVGADGSVWIIGNNSGVGGYGIYQYNKGSNTWNNSANSWNGIVGGGVRIAVDPSGLPWVANFFGTVFQAIAVGSWIELGGTTCAKDIGIGADGQVAIIGCNVEDGGYGIYELNQGRGWNTLPDSALDIAVGPSGAPWVVNTYGDIFNYTCNQPDFSYFPCSGPTKDSSWTYSPSFSTITCPGTGYTYLGPYGGGGKATSSPISLPAHQGLSVSFQLAFIDSWDGEAFKISANGVLVYSQTHAYHTQSFSNTCGNAKYNDAYTSVAFGFNHTASTLTLLVTSGLDEAASNEGWGICNLNIQSTSCPVLADGTVTTC